MQRHQLVRIALLLDVYLHQVTIKGLEKVVYLLVQIVSVYRVLQTTQCQLHPIGLFLQLLTHAPLTSTHR
jgi:hypothetical protein